MSPRPLGVSYSRLGSARKWAGYRYGTVARTTGTVVVLVEAEAQGIDVQDGGRWALICDDHGGLLQSDSQTQLRASLPHPEEWCPGCQERVL